MKVLSIDCYKEALQGDTTTLDVKRQKNKPHRQSLSTTYKFTNAVLVLNTPNGSDAS